METINKKNTLFKTISITVILIATVFSYSNIFGHGFQAIWGDDLYLLNNRIQEFSFKNLGSYFWSFHAGNYHPLTSLSFAVNFQIFGLNPTAFHIQNLILHLVNTVLIFILINKISNKTEIAIVVALFFGIHPMHVESVTWISGRKDLIYSLFFLISLIYYHKYLTSDLRRKYLNISLLMFLLSLLGKSMAMTLPLVLLLMDYFTARKISKKEIIEKVPFFILSIIVGIVALIGRNSVEAITVTEQFSIIDRFFLISFGILSYIVMVFYPFREFGQSAMHFYPEKVNGIFPLEYYIAPAIILVLLILIFILKRYRRDLIFGFLFFLLTISVVTQIIPTSNSIIAERYTYIPYIGLFFIIAYIYNQLANKWKFKSVVKPVLILILLAMGVVFAGKTWNRNRVWKDSVKLFGNVARRYPDNPEGYFKKGLARYNEDDVRGAVIDYNFAANIDRSFPDTYFWRGIARFDLALPEPAISDLSHAIELEPENYKAYLERGRIKFSEADYTGAFNDFQAVTHLNPKNGEAYYYSGLCRQQLDDNNGACSDWKKSLSLGFKAAEEPIKDYCSN